jgi:hypothetical protein
MSLNVFDVQRSIECWGLWYALWCYGPRQSWTIFVAWRLAVRDARWSVNGVIHEKKFY